LIAVEAHYGAEKLLEVVAPGFCSDSDWRLAGDQDIIFILHRALWEVAHNAENQGSRSCCECPHAPRDSFLAEDVEVQLYRLDLGVEILDVRTSLYPMSGFGSSTAQEPTHLLPTPKAGRLFLIPIPFGKTIRAGDLIEVEIEPSIEQKDEDEWVIISPWEGKFQLPPEDNGNFTFCSCRAKKKFRGFPLGNRPSSCSQGLG